MRQLRIMDLKCQTTGIAAADGCLYFGHNDGYGEVYCFSSYGTFRWVGAVENRVTCAPVVKQGVVYVLHGQGGFCLFDQASGKRIRCSDPENIIECHFPPVIDSQGRIFIGGWAGTYCMVNPGGDGASYDWLQRCQDCPKNDSCQSQSLKACPLPTRRKIFPVLGQAGNVYFGNWSGYIFRLEEEKGVFNRTRTFDAQEAGIADKVETSDWHNSCPICAGKKGLYFLLNEKLYFINPDLECPSLKCIKGDMLPGTPITDEDGIVYASFRERGECFFAALTPEGEVKWRTSTELIYPPVWDKQGHILAVNEKELLLINPQGGRIEDFFRPNKDDHFSSSPIIGEDKYYLLTKSRRGNRIYVLSVRGMIV